MCGHLAAVAALVIAVLWLVLHTRDGFRSQDEKRDLAQRIAGGDPKQEPSYDAMKALGLDGAEYYETKQLWNNKKFTPANVARVL